MLIFRNYHTVSAGLVWGPGILLLVAIGLAPGTDTLHHPPPPKTNQDDHYEPFDVASYTNGEPPVDCRGWAWVVRRLGGSQCQQPNLSRSSLLCTNTHMRASRPSRHQVPVGRRGRAARVLRQQQGRVDGGAQLLAAHAGVHHAHLRPDFAQGAQQAPLPPAHQRRHAQRRQQLRRPRRCVLPE